MLCIACLKYFLKMITDKLPGQKGIVIWLLGLSGAGKSTIAQLAEDIFTSNGYFSVRLDGDALREGINKSLGFTDDDRAENIRRTAEIAGILCSNNVITICSLITPLNSHREIARSILKENYLEVFVDCPIEVCAARDVKGLYKQAMAKQISNFTGIGSAFERPQNPQLILRADTETAESCAQTLYKKVLPLISLRQVV
jgi:adenylylsulfate kinase